MAAPTAEYQLWPSASYDGFGTASTDYWPALETKLDAWITAISGNASITANSALPIKKKGVADSTAPASRIGIVLELPYASAPSYFFYSANQGTTLRYAYVNDGWTDNGTNNGYGPYNAGNNTGTSATWAASGIDLGIFLAQDTTDGQEFFIAGCAGPNSNYELVLMFVARTVEGGWCSVVRNTATAATAMWHNQTTNSVAIDSNVTESNLTYTPLTAQDTLGAAGIGPGYSMIPANPRLLHCGQSYRTGAYFGNGTNSAYQVGYYSPRVVI
jgi:hypothetical protein